MESGVHYRVNNSPSLYPALGQINPVWTLLSYLFMISVIIIVIILTITIVIRLRLSPCMHLLLPLRARCRTISSPYSITRTVSG